MSNLILKLFLLLPKFLHLIDRCSTDLLLELLFFDHQDLNLGLNVIQGLIFGVYHAEKPLSKSECFLKTRLELITLLLLFLNFFLSLFSLKFQFINLF